MDLFYFTTEDEFLNRFISLGLVINLLADLFLLGY